MIYFGVIVCAVANFVTGCATDDQAEATSSRGNYKAEQAFACIKKVYLEDENDDKNNTMVETNSTTTGEGTESNLQEVDSIAESAKKERKFEYLCTIIAYNYTKEGKLLFPWGITMPMYFTPDTDYSREISYGRDKDRFYGRRYFFRISNDQKANIDCFYVRPPTGLSSKKVLAFQFEGKFELDKPFEIYRYLPKGWDKKILKKISDVKFPEDEQYEF